MQLHRLFADEEHVGSGTRQDLRIHGDGAARLGPEQRRSLSERRRRYENSTHVIDTTGRGALESHGHAPSAGNPL